MKTTEKRLAKHFASGLAVFTASCFEKYFLDHVGANTPEEQLATIVEMVEAMPEGPIREVGHSLIALSQWE